MAFGRGLWVDPKDDNGLRAVAAVFFPKKIQRKQLEPEHLKYTPLEKEHYHPVSSKTSFFFWGGS